MSAAVSPMPPPPSKQALPKGMTELRLHNYLQQAMSSQNVNRTLLINAHNWIFSNQMPVSNPKLHELLAQCFNSIQSHAAATYHVRRAELLRNRSAQQLSSDHVAQPERRASSSDHRVHVSDGCASKTDQSGKQPSSDNLLKRARSRSRFSELHGSESLEARPKRSRLQTDAEPSIQPMTMQQPPHVHDFKPYDKNDYMPSLKTAVRMLGKECEENGTSSAKVRFSYEIDNDRKEMEVSIDIKAHVPKMAEKATDGVVKVKGYCRFGSQDDITDKGSIYEKARNRSARLAVADVNDIRRVIEKACYSELRVYVEELTDGWKTRDFSSYCYRAFEKAKTLILSEAKGNLYGASVSLYGSVPTGLILGESDIDVSVSVPMLFESYEDGDPYRIKSKSIDVLKFLALQMKKEKMENVFVVTQARVPVLRYIDRETQVNVDVTLNNDRSLLLSRLLRRHMHKDARIWELCMMVKYWAKQRKLCGVVQGHINSMGWVIMVIFFLQHLVHPRVASLYRPKKTKYKFTTVVEEPWRDSKGSGGVNEQPTHVLLMEFFRVFGERFEFEREAISMTMLYRESTKYISKGATDRPLFIEQPLQEGRNVVDYVSRRTLEIARQEMRAAYRSLAAQRCSAAAPFAVRQLTDEESYFYRR